MRLRWTSATAFCAIFPPSRARFLELGFGKPIGLFAYDIAAAALIAQEAGAVVTDAYGHSLDTTRLLDTSEPNLQSILGASNPELHEKLLAALNRGSARLRHRLRRQNEQVQKTMADGRRRAGRAGAGYWGWANRRLIFVNDVTTGRERGVSRTALAGLLRRDQRG